MCFFCARPVFVLCGKNASSYRSQKLLVRKNCSQSSSLPQTTTHTKKKMCFGATVLLRTLCRRWTNHHHPLNDSNETHGRPQSTPSQHSQRSDLRDLHYFPSNDHTPTLQRIYRFFYHHRCSSSIGAGDDHETDAVWFGGRADSNCFFVTRKKIKRCSI